VSDLALRDSRRLTGHNLLCNEPGAVIDVTLGSFAVEDVIEGWSRHARRVLDAVGWSDQRLHTRSFSDGASLMMTAPIDALYAATEVNEWAWSATEATLNEWTEPDLKSAARSLAGTITAERNPRLIKLRDAAVQRSVCFLSDDENASVGMGVGSQTWPVEALPDPDEVDWDRVHDIPLALVTGSNGKTTTVRIVAAMLATAGYVTGYSSTDGIYVGDELVDADDWSGPGGGRQVLRDTRVEAAVLETARGGILRRGVAVTRADAAIVTNVAADHLGEWGVDDLNAIADAKLVVARAMDGGGRLVLNAEDPVLVERAALLEVAPTWFAEAADTQPLRARVAAGESAYFIDDASFAMAEAGQPQRIVDVADVPITLDGVAHHNIQNVLGAIAIARALGLSADVIRSSLTSFGGTTSENPGRGNVFELGGARAIVDFAHNPHGLEALMLMAASFPAGRRLLVLGQAGDRDDDSIRELARAAARFRPDRIVIKELEKYLRGRSQGEVPDLIEDELRAAGMPSEAMSRAASELAAVREALEWAHPDDLLIFPVHSHRDEVLALLTALAAEHWGPGMPVPR
jgi:UDP-N-acetylmuramyl tripeptide synthase